MKTRWIRRLLWLAGFACLWLNVFDDPPLRTGPYVQDVTTEAATIAKVTDVASEARVVVTDRDGRVVAERRSDGSRRRHALRITGLEPERVYEYVLTTTRDGEERGSLRTAPARDDAPVRFAFLGDSGGQPWWTWLQRTPALHLPARWGWLPPRGPVVDVAAGVAAHAPDFVLHLGDVIYPSGRHAHYAAGFFRPFAEVLRHAPVYPVVGNHDVMDAAGQQVLANFHVPSCAQTGDGRCFSFARGPVRVLALDCNTHYAGDRFEPGHPSSDFLAAQLRTCTEPWIVVASHFPIRSASRQRNRGDLMVTLLPELAAHHVSLYLSGHDHCYQRFGPGPDMPVPLVVSGGGGKSLYEVRPGEGAAVLASAYHWCSAETVGDALRVVAHGLDGQALDSFELALPSGAELDALRASNPGRAARIDALRQR